MLEAEVEKYLVSKVRTLGGRAYKFTSPQWRAVPDRICVFPCGVIAFVELKRPGKRPTEEQWRELNWLKSKGFIATYIDTKPKVDAFIDIMCRLIKEEQKWIQIKSSILSKLSLN